MPTREELEQELAELDREISFLQYTRERVLSQIEKLDPL